MAIGKTKKGEVQVIPTPENVKDIGHMGITRTEAKKKQKELKDKVKNK